MTILYATTNPGKFEEAERHFSAHGYRLSSPEMLGISQLVEETGQSLEENAVLKAEAYIPYVSSDTIVIGDDTGIEIDALGGEPGIKVRRWLGYPMTDQEIIDYTLKRLKKVTQQKRTAQFRTVLAIAQKGRATVVVDGVLRGSILTAPIGRMREGMPFWQIFYIPELKMTLGQFHSKSIKYQLIHPTHREKAIATAVTYLSTTH
ncbi:MAG: XTP/dITP diphosphatase [Candidatus Microgenomates bacterium]